MNRHLSIHSDKIIGFSVNQMEFILRDKLRVFAVKARKHRISKDNFYVPLQIFLICIESEWCWLSLF